MALPHVDIPQFGVPPHVHRAFKRIAKNRGVSMSALGRELVEEFVRKEIHDAKVVLGMDVDNGEQGELDLAAGESHRAAPNRGQK